MGASLLLACAIGGTAQAANHKLSKSDRHLQKVLNGRIKLHATMARSLAFAPNGAVIVGGTRITGTERNPGVAIRIDRFTDAGQLDPTFTPVRLAPGDGAMLSDLAVTSSGSIVAVGEVRNAAGEFDVFVTRLNPNGSIDPSFGDGGF